MRLATSIMIAALLLGTPADGASPRQFRIEGVRGFAEGRLLDVALDDLGSLTLAPTTRLIGDTGSPAVYAVAATRDGAALAGTGSEGQLVRVDGEGATVVFDADEPLVTAVAVGPDGQVYVATSPDGKVYAVNASGRATTLLEPGATYIWALALDAAGHLFVATGAPARLLEWSPDGKTKELLASPEVHIQSLALGEEGVVFAGTSPGGIIYRIDEGRTSALLDSPYAEVKALARRPDGTLYALLSNGKPQPAPAPQPPPPPADPAAKSEVTVTESFVVPSTPGSTAQAASTGDAVPADATAGMLLRISPDGSRETLWASTDETPFALALSREGCVVAAGGEGRLQQVSDGGTVVTFGPLAAEQIVALAPARDGFIAGTANPGAVFSVGPERSPRGSYESPVRDAGSHSRWGQVAVLAEVPPGTSVGVATRSGNTAVPDVTWSDWSPHRSEAKGHAISSPASRFLQLRLDLVGTASESPRVHSLSAAYLPANRRPRVTEVIAHPPGEVLQKTPIASESFDVLGLTPPLPSRTPGQPGEAPDAPPPSSYARKSYLHGLRTFSWKAEDPDGDGLRYTVSCRRLGDGLSRILRADLDEAVLAWDTRNLPDGRYVLSVEASDSPGNPAPLALTARRESAPFDIDNEAPKLEVSVVSYPERRVRARVIDAASFVRRLEYSLDGSVWHEVYPEDGIPDSRLETYDFVVPSEPATASRGFVAVRAFDALGNGAIAHVALR